jgi:hypothetical protein
LGPELRRKFWPELLRFAGRMPACEVPTKTGDGSGRIGAGAVRTIGVVGLPPGNTTLPKVRIVPGVVADVPPGNTTLPKVRVMGCAETPNDRNSKAEMPAAAFMDVPPDRIVHPSGKPAELNYFFLVAGGAALLAGGVAAGGLAAPVGVVVGGFAPPAGAAAPPATGLA